ncbi:unnamed protein product, partial [Rotaria sp. Silwood1]
SIKKSDDLQLIYNNEEQEQEKNKQYQRFTISATIADINKENQLDILHQYLLCSNDFVPSTDIQLLSFQFESLIQFTVIDQNLPVLVIIQNDKENKSIQFNCRLSITIKRLCEIVCQLFNINDKDFYLNMNDITLNDDDISLEDIDKNMTQIQFQMISKTTIYCSIMYSNQNITLPCNDDTSIMAIVKEIFQKLHISENDMNMYELIALNDDQTQISFDLSIDDIRQLFPIDSTTVSLQLKNINE